MLIIGLTGGIGSGKSAVADLLVDRGAVLVDADVVAREVVAPGGPAYEPLVERFGTGILDEQGALDRQALADVAFGDAESLAALNAITHPAIGIEMISQLEAARSSGHDVVAAIPLLTTLHRETLALDVVVVVDCPIEIAIERLVAYRGFSEHDAKARVAAQISRSERLEMADEIVNNAGDRAALESEVDSLWARLDARWRKTPGR